MRSCLELASRPARDIWASWCAESGFVQALSNSGVGKTTHRRAPRAERVSPTSAGQVAFVPLASVGFSPVFASLPRRDRRACGGRLS